MANSMFASFNATPEFSSEDDSFVVLDSDERSVINNDELGTNTGFDIMVRVTVILFIAFPFL